MTPYEELLRLIETVDPSDTEKLDEIDALVYCWLHNKPFVNVYTDGAWGPTIIHEMKDDKYTSISSEHPMVTRSRDALKAIRPNGWYFVVGQNWARCGRSPEVDPEINTYALTEELAELYAIIQAIQHERDNK